MNNLVRVCIGNRNVNLFSKKSDIRTKLDVKIMQFEDKGFFYIHNNKFFDVEGRFDIQFDQGTWNDNLLKVSVPV